MLLLERDKCFNAAYYNKQKLPNQERIKLYHKADSLSRALKSWEYSIVSLAEICNLYQLDRAYDQYDHYSKEAIYIARSFLKEDNPYSGMAFNLRGGVIYKIKKDYTNAIKLFQEAIDRDKRAGASLADISVSYFNMGTCYLDAGDYNQAIDISKKSLRIQLDSFQNKSFLIPTLYNQLGSCYSKKNQWEQAIVEFKKGLKYANGMQPENQYVNQIILYLYQNLADVYLQSGQDDLAQKYIKEALIFQKDKTFQKDGYTFQLQGEYLMQQADYQKALKAFNNSTASLQSEYKAFDKHPEIGATYFYTANAWLNQHKLDSALYYYQLNLIHNSSSFKDTDWTKDPSINTLINPLNAIDAFVGKAKAFLEKYEKEKNPKAIEQAYNNYDLAVAAISKTRQSFNADGSKYTLAEKVIPVYEGAIKTALLLHQLTKDKKWLEKGFQFAEANKAATLLEAMQNNEAMGTTGISDSLLSEEYNLKVEIAFYERIIHEARQEKDKVDAQRISKLENKLFDFNEAYRKLINHFEKEYPAYYTLKFQQEKINLKHLQQNLKQTILIEYFVGAENIFAFTITKKSIHCEQIAKGKDFEKNIQELRRITSTRPTSKLLAKHLDDFIKLSRLHYQYLLEQPISNAFDHANELIIVPDDILAYLPFSTLLENMPAPENQSFKKLPYLFKTKEISYNYSGALWLKHLDKKIGLAEKGFLGFAPTFNTLTGEHKLSPLSCNTTEVNNIGHVLNANDMQLEVNATLEGFKNNVADYQIVHLATHTMLDDQNSAFNRIYFSDNYLSQNDLYQLRLNADLVVLSACNTGAGNLQKGEGVMSLSRGFIHAGCPSVLMSLWSVDDCTTADIMLDYYEALNEGESKMTALRSAKTQYLEETEDAIQSHPFFWAAFVQYGNTTPILSHASNSYLLVLSLLALGLVGFYVGKKLS